MLYACLSNANKRVIGIVVVMLELWMIRGTVEIASSTAVRAWILTAQNGFCALHARPAACFPFVRTHACYIAHLTMLTVFVALSHWDFVFHGMIKIN